MVPGFLTVPAEHAHTGLAITLTKSTHRVGYYPDKYIIIITGT